MITPKLCCPFCAQFESRVTMSRPMAGDGFRRVRSCLHCKRSYTTVEILEHRLPQTSSTGIIRNVQI
jgi:transcriptional regulator NrdR family protein